MKNLLHYMIIFLLLIFCSGFKDAIEHVPPDHTNGTESSLQIEITDIETGPGKITAAIVNMSGDDIFDVDWSVEVTGGICNGIYSRAEGSIFTIPAGESERIESRLVFGIGCIAIRIQAHGVEKSVEGSVFLSRISVRSDADITLETIADGFVSPVALETAGDGSGTLYVVDQTGVIYVIQQGETLAEPFLDISMNLVDLDPTYDERGLLGLAFHPEYADNGRFFIYYSAPASGQGVDHETRLSAFRVSDNPNEADRDSEQTLLRIRQPEANHNGGRITFGPDGYLYLAIGDGGGAGDMHGEIGNGQDIETLLGSILRIDVDRGDLYAVPDDNPFVGRPGRDEIYAWGFRNPWRFSFDKLTGQLFAADVGQDRWEEVDIVVPGGNYGWRILEGNNEYDPALADELMIDMELLEPPIHEYSHSLGRSITGGYVYRGDSSSVFYGSYIFGDWSSSFIVPRGQLFALTQNDDGTWTRSSLNTGGRLERFVLSFGEDDDGQLYVLTKTGLGPDPAQKNGDVRKLLFKR